jgi:hypothetical protein
MQCATPWLLMPTPLLVDTCVLIHAGTRLFQAGPLPLNARVSSTAQCVTHGCSHAIYLIHLPASWCMQARSFFRLDPSRSTRVWELLCASGWLRGTNPEEAEDKRRGGRPSKKNAEAAAAAAAAAAAQQQESGAVSGAAGGTEGGPEGESAAAEAAA